MVEQDDICLFAWFSETGFKGTGLIKTAGKEDPVELDSSPTLWIDLGDVA